MAIFVRLIQYANLNTSFEGQENLSFHIIEQISDKKNEKFHEIKTQKKTSKNNNKSGKTL